jgi:hypothetical protein
MTIKAHPMQVDHVLICAQRRCEDLNIDVTFSDRAQTAYTNGQSIVLPAVAQPITVKQLDTLYGQIIHETGHHLRPEAFKILASAKPPEHLCALYNIVEDDGMERERAEAYRGDAKALSVMNTHLVGELGEAWSEQASLDSDEQDPAPLACLALNQLSRLQWETETDVPCRSFIRYMPSKVKDLIAELESEGWVDKLRATKTAHDTWDVAVDLAKRLYPDEEKQDEYEEIRGAGHSMAGQRDDSDSNFEDSQTPQEAGQAGDGGDEGSPVQGEGEDSEGLDETRNDEGRTVSWKDCVLSEHNEWAPRDSDGAGELGITWQGRVSTGGAKLAPTNLINVVDLAKSPEHADKWGGGSPKNFMPSDAHSRAFANKIRRYIQSQARSTIQKDKEYGKIDRGNLYRLAMPMVDGGEWNKKIFYDQRKHTMKDTAIFVLVDWSGSMMGNKMKYAADAAQRLVWCFDRVLNVPVALAAFTDRQSFCDIGYVKKWNTRGLSAEEIAKRFSKFYWYTSANNDADSVHWAYHELMKRKESRKILIVMSDGAPAGSWKGHADDSLKLATSTIEKDPRVELYGLGICDQAVERYYTNWQVVWNVHDISPALFNLIKEGNKV